jgi:nucleotide-binding universal stress UspA family protein
MKILVAYDGTLHAKKALKYGIGKLQNDGGEMKVLHVFDSSLFVDYDAGPRAEEMARHESARQLEDAKKIIRDGAAGLSVRIIAEEGNFMRKLADQVAADRPDLVLAPPRFKEAAASLSCPVIIVPGTILVPMDNAGTSSENISSIVREASAMGSKVLLLGVVPIHLYSREERKELEQMNKDTRSEVKKLKKMLAEQGIEVSESYRAGYPDEEILKEASEHAVSLILLPSGGTTPSELSKAAAILLDENEQVQWPVSLLPAGGTA